MDQSWCCALSSWYVFKRRMEPHSAAAAGTESCEFVRSVITKRKWIMQPVEKAHLFKVSLCTLSTGERHSGYAAIFAKTQVNRLIARLAILRRLLEKDPTLAILCRFQQLEMKGHRSCALCGSSYHQLCDLQSYFVIFVLGFYMTLRLNAFLPLVGFTTGQNDGHAHKRVNLYAP